MSAKTLQEEGYWEERYQEGSDRWDIGYASPPIMEYVEEQVPLHANILYPGCGRGYEVIDLFKKGYDSIYALDESPTALNYINQNTPGFPEGQLLNKDFFDLGGSFDFIIEQTFFCALDPSLRERYVEKMHELLINNGILFGVLWSVDFPGGPPFGGNESEYRALFGGAFDILTLEACDNSIAPRAGRELFIQLRKK